MPNAHFTVKGAHSGLPKLIEMNFLLEEAPHKPQKGMSAGLAFQILISLNGTVYRR